MLKKITCAFCLVISLFIVAVLVYLLLTVNSSDKPPEIKVPKISLYLVNATSGQEKLLHGTANSDYILNYQQHNFISESYESEVPSRSLLLIRCHSNYPVLLKYIGFGNVTEAKNYNRREIEDFTDRSSYKFITELEFSTVDEGLTGKYDCQVRDDQGELLSSSFLFIYAAGMKTFVTHSTRELVADPWSNIEIPCPVSHPNKAISLISVLQLLDDTAFEKEIESETIHSYDPKAGYTLHPNHFGLFYCRDDRSLEASGRVTVFKPLNKVVKGRSLRLYSQNVDNRDGTLKLECRATEPVKLVFKNFIKFTKQPRELRNDTQEFPYAVRIKINREWFRGNISIVECHTKRDRRVVRTWKFLKEELPENADNDDLQPRVKLEHSEKQGGYQCCSSQSNILPMLRTYPCRTPTECELRQPCLSIDPLRTSPAAESCPLLKTANEAIYQGSEGCTILRLEGTMNSSGIIRCFLDSDSRDYAYFTGDEMEGTHSSLELINSRRKKIEPNAILKIRKISKTNSAIQKVLRFECKGSKLHFASGFQWGLEKFDKPFKYLNNEGSRISTDSGLHHEWIDVKYTDATNKRFYCFAPLINPSLNGMQWMNVSIGF